MNDRTIALVATVARVETIGAREPYLLLTHAITAIRQARNARNEVVADALIVTAIAYLVEYVERMGGPTCAPECNGHEAIEAVATRALEMLCPREEG